MAKKVRILTKFNGVSYNKLKWSVRCLLYGGCLKPSAPSGKAWNTRKTISTQKLAIANERKHGTTRQKPIEQRLQVEVACLKVLPPLVYKPEETATAVV